MNSYKVRSCCSTSGCDYVYHRDIIQTINHESSFSFSMFMNGLNELDVKMKCPQCGQRMFFYPVSSIAEPVHCD
ncbi:rubredoxin [Paenibacillus sp. PvR052]|nr:rubredoxin [Paenibacillus sp. PvP091]MBP1169101.1 rubredoxin [Paenibacillus sp. PvR098]MBP2440129.1 rubredoxin [Paenibacillus sp. PvP052]